MFANTTRQCDPQNAMRMVLLLLMLSSQTLAIADEMADENSQGYSLFNTCFCSTCSKHLVCKEQANHIVIG